MVRSFKEKEEMKKERGKIRSVYIYAALIKGMEKVCEDEEVSVNSYINKLIASNLKKRRM